MAYLVGTDEAGYGPNLGPLVIGSTLWRVPDGLDGEQLYDRLPGILAPGEQSDGDEPATLRIGDSKTLYKRGSGLGALERGVFAAVLATQDSSAKQFPMSWRTLLTACDERCAGTLDEVPWYAGYERSVPCDATLGEIELAGSVLNDALQSAGIELLAIRTRIVFPKEFNERVTQCGSKGSALSLWTLELIESQLQSASDGPVLIECDKHGGRNRYAGLIQHTFPDHFIEVVEETRMRSTYRWGPPARRVGASFVAKGERLLPAALASMFAKYLRELAMEAFNRYWQAEVPGIKATAGYPVDAKRFRGEIEARQKELAIADSVLWRAK